MVGFFFVLVQVSYLRYMLETKRLLQHDRSVYDCTLIIASLQMGSSVRNTMQETCFLFTNTYIQLPAVSMFT